MRYWQFATYSRQLGVLDEPRRGDEVTHACEYCQALATRTRTDDSGTWYYCPAHAPNDAEIIPA